MFCSWLVCASVFFFLFFFFSSRRRHTRFDCDWSSDVCSSDLARTPAHSQQGPRPSSGSSARPACGAAQQELHARASQFRNRSEEHTSELQSQSNLVCRLLLEKKKQRRHAQRLHVSDDAPTSRT